MIEEVEKIKRHMKKHRTVYISGGITLGVGAVSFFTGTRFAQVSASQTINGLVNIKPTQNLTQITTLVRRGHPGDIIQCIETGELFASKNRAAEMMKINRRSLVEHLNGLRDNVGGFTFKNLGEAS